jgi:fumarylpyruvate hydrolase
MSYIFTPPLVPSLPIRGESTRFPVHRIYCVGRNYEKHAREMGFTPNKPPFFFTKPADAVVAVLPDQTIPIPYPSLTTNLHHEVELVIAIGIGGKDIDRESVKNHIYGYAVGIDLTRRDLQTEMKSLGRPWSIAKAFDYSAPVGRICPVSQVADIHNADIALYVNGHIKQQGNTKEMLWDIPDIVVSLSKAWNLQAGDLIFTGTPAGVGAIVKGDTIKADIKGLDTLKIEIISH